MDARTRVFAVDFSLASGAIAVGVLGAGGSLGWNLAIACLGAGVLVGCLFLAEQTPLLEQIERYSPYSHVAAFALTLAVGVVLVLGWTVVAAPAATLLLGMGVGLALYRVQYGVRTPIPECRLEQMGQGTTLDIDPPNGQS